MMPRGVPKTWTERRRDQESYDRYRDMRREENPPGSPCVGKRLRHRFRHNKTRGSLTLRDDGDLTCWWCGKTYRQVKEEQKAARELRQEKRRREKNA